jgi:hypothetical protein
MLSHSVMKSAIIAVELTDSGSAMLATASELADQLAGQLLSCFGEQEQSTFKTLLARFVAAVPLGADRKSHQVDSASQPTMNRLGVAFV